jgi:hypothetical protein
MSKTLALKEAKYWLRNLSVKEALEATATLKNDVVRGGSGEVKITSPLNPKVPLLIGDLELTLLHWTHSCGKLTECCFLRTGCGAARTPPLTNSAPIARSFSTAFY